MSTGSMDPYYRPRHHRQTPSWTPPQYSDMLQSYDPQQRTQYSSPPQLSHPQPGSSLPPLRDLTSGSDSHYPPPAGIYTQSYGTAGITSNSLDTSSYANDRSYYDSNRRYGQEHPQTNRRQAPVSPDYYRCQSSTYASMDYSSASMISPHPSSPSGTDVESRNRRRRGNLPKQITDILRGWFHEHLDHPYPTEEDKQAFVARTGLTLSQV